MTPPDITDWLEREPYAMAAADKSPALARALGELTEWHRSRCAAYARILRLVRRAEGPPVDPESVPFIPVRLFKEFDLASVEPERIFKTMTSSGTTGQQVSRIHLDRETAALQAKVLARLMATLLGRKRLPMLVIDSPAVVRDRQGSARAAGILGFSLFGQDLTYALDETMQLDLAAVKGFLDRHAGQPIFLFGFTSIVWQHFYLPLKALGMRLPIEQGILVHGGGWKKLQDQAVDARAFRAAMSECAGIREVRNYYGMVEQTGAIHLECEQGHLHAPVCADVVVRDPVDFQPLPKGETGLIEVLSLLPRSYPGHALLTEDLGRIEGEDDCACGRLGKYFSVAGRVARAEVRGCSDTYEKRS